jgi:hypothetical protein
MKRRTLSITTEHYILETNGQVSHQRLTLPQADEVLKANGVQIAERDLEAALWAGVSFTDGFGFPSSIRDSFRDSWPFDQPPIHLSQSDFYDEQQSAAEARQQESDHQRQRAAQANEVR